MCAVTLRRAVGSAGVKCVELVCSLDAWVPGGALVVLLKSSSWRPVELALLRVTCPPHSSNAGSRLQGIARAFSDTGGAQSPRAVCGRSLRNGPPLSPVHLPSTPEKASRPPAGFSGASVGQECASRSLQPPSLCEWPPLGYCLFPAVFTAVEIEPLDVYTAKPRDVTCDV